MRRYWAYFKAVIKHKRNVLASCAQFGVPWWRGLLHDWDKFLPDEFLPYTRTFYQPDGSKQYVESDAFAYAWMKHQHRNKHHWQYWLRYHPTPESRWSMPIRDMEILVWDRGEGLKFPKNRNPYLIGREHFSADAMPDEFIREMLADWYGASMTYSEDHSPASVWAWYEKNKDKMILHPHTRAQVEHYLKG